MENCRHFPKQENSDMGLLTKLFGTRSEHEVKKIMPAVNKILALEEEYKALDEASLRQKTHRFFLLIHLRPFLLKQIC